ISSLRVISSVSEQYRSRYGSYAPDLPTLYSLGYIDNVLAAGQRSGYDFVFTATASDWNCTAEPTMPGHTGDRHFYCDSSGVIRFETSATASTSSSPI
ncbi:MAG: hypothetical protein KDC38_19245, partial [Planctomycetes bacterium]|nr:hypothetical protein [Planctomycetota bacterium]